jgi:mannose-1-phosphate guanylyltransferase
MVTRGSVVRESIVPVLLAGGVGSRLWPLSRPESPKQFLPLLGPLSPFGELLSVAVYHEQPPVIVAAQGHRAHIERELERHAETPLCVIAEEAPCSTAAALCLSILLLRERGIEPRRCAVLVTSCDIAFDWYGFYLCDEFHGIDAVASNQDMVFAVSPPPMLAPALEAVACGYGHLQVLEDGRVERLIEKPSCQEARVLRRNGALWSSGLYALCGDHVLDSLRQHHPQVLAGCESALKHARREACGPHEWVVPCGKYLQEASMLSLDNAIVRHLPDLRAATLEGRWADLGTWASLHAASPRDRSDNAACGNARLIDARHCYVRSDKSRVTVAGLENVAVIEHEGEILVVPLDRAHEYACVVLAPSSPKPSSGHPAPRRK